MIKNTNWEMQVTNSLKDIAKEMKSISKSLEVIAQDIRKKQSEKDNQLIKGMK
jgi:hypothetical protein